MTGGPRSDVRLWDTQSQTGAMLHHKLNGDTNCHYMCVHEADSAGMIERWATDEDAAYAAGRRGAQATLLALATLRALLFRLTQQDGWVVMRAPNGKPSLKNQDGQAGPFISLAHTPGLVAVAVAQSGAIGIDVERHLPRRFTALADAAFGPLERLEVAAGGLHEFYRIWTLREALAKATGDGLALVLNRIDVCAIIGCNEICQTTQWQLHHLVPHLGFSLSVASCNAVKTLNRHFM